MMPGFTDYLRMAMGWWSKGAVEEQVNLTEVDYTIRTDPAHYTVIGPLMHYTVKSKPIEYTVHGANG